MRAKSWRLILALLLVLGCGDKTEVKVTDVKPVVSKPDPGKPVTGDWLVMHSLSDPEQLNPLTSNDSASSDILELIFEGLLSRDPRTLAFKPVIAETRPEISQDHLSYTFKIRKDAHFQDGRPVTGEDVLFSVKAIKCPFVNAPFLRVYFDSLIDAELIDPYTIRFLTKEPYFLNESVLGGITISCRGIIMTRKSFGAGFGQATGEDPRSLPPKVKRFGDHFNKNYSRNPMGSGPYQVCQLENRPGGGAGPRPKYWGRGKAGIDQVYLDRQKFRIINNADAALIRLKSGSLDFIEGLQPLQHVRGTGSRKIQARVSNLRILTRQLTRTSVGTTTIRFFATNGCARR